MKLYIENNQAIPAGILLQDIDPAPAGFTLSVKAADFKKFSYLFGSYREMRNEIITSALPNWATITSAEKMVLVENYVFPTTETSVNLDLLYPLIERNKFRDNAIKRLNENVNCNIKKASDGIKYWNILTTNAGTINTTEFLSNTIL